MGSCGNSPNHESVLWRIVLVAGLGDHALACEVVGLTVAVLAGGGRARLNVFPDPLRLRLYLTW